jgi:hypothetical protein
MTLNERELFESDLAEHLIERDANGFYINDEIQNSWEKHLLKAKIKKLEAELEKAKAQVVPEDCVIVPKELHIEIAMKMAKERIFKQSAGNDHVWNELVEQAYKDNLQAEQYRLIRDYREMVKASESGAEG